MYQRAAYGRAMRRDRDGKPTEGQLEARRELLDHVAWHLRPPVQLFEELEDAIELAAAGKLDEPVWVDRWRRPVREVIEDWDLEYFVEHFGEEPNPPKEAAFPFDVPF